MRSPLRSNAGRPADPPSNPRAWLVNVGRNKAIDRVRRQIAFRGKQQELLQEIELAAPTPAMPATMRRSMTTCCG